MAPQRRGRVSGPAPRLDVRLHQLGSRRERDELQHLTHTRVPQRHRKRHFLSARSVPSRGPRRGHERNDPGRDLGQVRICTLQREFFLQVTKVVALGVA